MADISTNMDSMFNLTSNNLCLSYTDRITEMHRQYLASIAPFNILFGNASLAATAVSNITNSESSPHTNNNSPINQEFHNPMTTQIPAASGSLNGSTNSNADMEYLDFSVDTLSNSSCSSTERMLCQSPSAFTPTCSTTKMSQIKKEKSSSPDHLNNATNNKSPTTAFSIENIIRKD